MVQLLAQTFAALLVLHFALHDSQAWLVRAAEDDWLLRIRAAGLRHQPNHVVPVAAAHQHHVRAVHLQTKKGENENEGRM